MAEVPRLVLPADNSTVHIGKRAGKGTMSYSRLTSAAKSHAAHLQPPKTDAITLIMFMMPSVWRNG